VATSAPDLPVNAEELALASTDGGTALVYGVLTSFSLSTTTFYFQPLSPTGQAMGQPTQLGSQSSENNLVLSVVGAGSGFLVCWDAADVGLSCSSVDLAGDVTPGFTAAGSGAVVTSGAGGDWVFYQADAGIVGQPLTSDAQAAPGAVAWSTSGPPSGYAASLEAVGVDSGYAVFWLGLSSSDLWWLSPQGASLGGTLVSLGSDDVDAQLAMAAQGDAVLLAFLTEADDVQGYFQQGATGSLVGPFELTAAGGVVATGLAVSGGSGAFASVWPDPTLTYRAVSGVGVPLGLPLSPSQPGNSAAPIALTAVPGGFLAAAAGIESSSGNPAIFVTSFSCP
jgi:hypothetical protein